MIARTWHGRVPSAKADEYFAYLQRTGLGDYQATPGNRGVLVLRRTEGDVTHFVLTTLWDSIEAIRRFAGADYERARYYSEDDHYLLDRELAVVHYDVLLAEQSHCATRSDRRARRVRPGGRGRRFTIGTACAGVGCLLVSCVGTFARTAPTAARSSRLRASTSGGG